MTTDAASARLFYEELFGWHMEVGGEDTGFYALASLDGRNAAGIGEMQMEHPPVWTTYLASADAEATMDAVARAGGTILQPPMDVMEYGRMAVIQDPTGGAVGIWQAKQHIGTAVVNEPGALVWNEFMTRDYGAATEFFTAVFSYTYTDMGADGFQYATIEVDGNTVGGIGTLPADLPAEVPPHWRAYFAVDDADESVDRVVKLGGTVIRPPADMPYGRHADVADVQGAMFSVIKPASPE